MKIFNSLHKTFTASMIVVAVLSIGLVGCFWMFQEYRQFSADARLMREDYIMAQKNLIKQEVDRVAAYIAYKRATTESELQKNIQNRVYEAVSLAENLYQNFQGKVSDGEIAQMIKEALRPIRFNQQRGYFFIYDMQGNNILLPFSPELEGRNLWDLKDSKGQYNIRRMTRMIREDGEGFLRWHWYKPGQKDRMSEKIGFSKRFESLGWWIGTGEYIEDFEKDIQQETLAWINKIRFGRDGYIFVYDFKAITLAHYKQSNIGIDRWDFKDANGVPVVRELIRISQEKTGGFLQYVGTIRPTTGLPAKKIGYARGVMDWQWMVGAGVYVESVEDILATKRAELKSKVRRDTLVILSVVLLSLLGIALVSRYIAGKTSKNLAAFSFFFEKAATESTRISDDEIHFSEFKRLALAANQMVDERKRAQASLKELETKLHRSRKMEALGVLAGGVAHDLNNVLSGVVSYPDLILADLPADSPLERRIRTIRDSGQKAADIVQDLLALARRGVTELEVLNLNDIISDYLASPEHENLMGYHPEVQLKSTPAPDLLNMHGSSVHLKKTVMNLVANAAEAQPDGGTIVISTENRYIDRSSDAFQQIDEGEYIVVRVVDQGTGIAQADLERIFEPFYTRKKLGRSGTGLGMAVVWGTVQDHNGQINVSSAKGQGTTFELSFRATREEMVQPESSPTLDQFQGNGETILVVDDVREQRELVEAILTRLGYRAIVVPTGEAAVQYLQQNRVDLMLLDMIMEPGIDGLETYKQVLAIHPYQKAVIASGFAETGRVKAAKTLGAGQYVKKPYTLEKIGMAVRAELTRS